MASRVERPCDKCEQTKPLTAFYATDNNRKPYADGSGWKYGVCKECSNKPRKRTSQSKSQPERARLPIDTLKKECSKCKEIKGFSKFAAIHAEAVKNGSRWRTNPCKACVKDARLLSKYGISLDTKKEMLEKQGRACEICQVPFINLKSAYVDHNHTTGDVRDLLCHNCNVAIGHLKENHDVVLGVIVYLAKHNGLSTDASKNTIAVALFLELPGGLRD